MERSSASQNDQSDPYDKKRFRKILSDGKDEGEPVQNAGTGPETGVRREAG